MFPHLLHLAPRAVGPRLLPLELAAGERVGSRAVAAFPTADKNLIVADDEDADADPWPPLLRLRLPAHNFPGRTHRAPKKL